jgi:hypothetical protein
MSDDVFSGNGEAVGVKLLSKTICISVLGKTFERFGF